VTWAPRSRAGWRARAWASALPGAGFAQHLLQLVVRIGLGVVGHAVFALAAEPEARTLVRKVLGRLRGPG
jgi:hypothetical protein